MVKNKDFLIAFKNGMGLSFSAHTTIRLCCKHYHSQVTVLINNFVQSGMF